jgi:plasmid stabilization system protein ParE
VTYRVELTPRARDDLDRLTTFTFERELARDGGDLTLHIRAFDSILKALDLLEWAPFTCRQVADSSFVRELVIPFGSAGYVALFEVVDADCIRVAAIRHQREDDYGVD